jgi:S-formylglutathione hydrolase
MALEQVSSAKSFGGQQAIYRHDSRETKTAMRVSVFTPSGLTCTEENFTVKAGAQRIATELGLMLVAPDTSPRGDNVPDDPDKAYDFGLGAGFYVDATVPPFAFNYRMYSYITTELPELISANLPADMARQAICGHSMGGHGALTIALKHPGRYRSVSALAPITSPINCPWGVKALTGYLGEDRAAWRPYDACALIEDGARVADILVDQGEADNFLTNQLKPELLETACAKAGIPLTLRRQPGYDHSYFFISTFIEDHLRWHGERLG